MTNTTTTVQTLKETLISQYSEEIVNAFMECFGEEYLEHLEDSYAGQAENDEEFVQDLLESTGEIPKNLAGYIYIDWVSTARDVMYDYSTDNGYYFRNF